MKNAIIVHGKPKEARYNNPELPKPHEANWLPWLSARLGERGVTAAIPQLPRPYYPVYEEWAKAFGLYDVNAGTALIGHSAGADFILRWLSKNKDASPERVVLVAPWHDADGKYGEFSKYTLDTHLGERVGRIAIFNSIDDGGGIQANVQRILGALPEARLTQFDGFGHFMLGNNMTTQEFPELLTELESNVNCTWKK